MEDEAEEGIFIWLRSAETFNEFDSSLSLELLQQVINDVRIFDDPDECLDAILCLPNEIFFVGLSCGRSFLVDTLEAIRQVRCIYLSESYEYDSTTKVRGVMDQFGTLLRQLERDVRICEHYHTHLTTCEIDMTRSETSTETLQRYMARFMWSQILLEMLLCMPSPPEERNKDFLDELQRLYRKNSFRTKQIIDFERSYTPTDAINWYTRTSFVFKVINKALRTRNIVIIYKFRSLIQDIYKQLREIQEGQLPLTSKRFGLTKFFAILYV